MTEKQFDLIPVYNERDWTDGDYLQIAFSKNWRMLKELMTCKIQAVFDAKADWIIIRPYKGDGVVTLGLRYRMELYTGRKR